MYSKDFFKEPTGNKILLGFNFKCFQIYTECFQTHTFANKTWDQIYKKFLRVPKLQLQMENKHEKRQWLSLRTKKLVWRVLNQNSISGLPAAWPWLCDLICLGLISFISKMYSVTMSILPVITEFREIQYWLLSTMSGTQKHSVNLAGIIIRAQNTKNNLLKIIMAPLLLIQSSFQFT